VTRKSVREYLAAQRTRYALGSRAERTRLLDEITAVSRYHRKAIIRHLRGDGRRAPGRRPVGRPRRYGAAVAEVAAVVWEAAGQIGAQRLHPFVRELLGRLMAFGEVHATPATAALLGQASLATLERLLAPARAHRPRRGAGATRPGTWLKHQIPIRTFAEWDDAEPGFLEVDLVAHCGATAGAFFLYTLCAVDVATSWVELEALWGKNLTRVQGAIHEIRRRLPMPLRGLDTDNGSEFINRPLLYSCYRTGLTFTRSRAYHKNDSAQVEQKNGAIVRALIGHDRFARQRAYAQFARVYRVLRWHINFFQPVQRLHAKTRHGAILHRVFDRAQTPFQRLCASGILSADRRRDLEALYLSLNPLQLRREIDAALTELWRLAVREPALPPPPLQSALGVR
jgi:hypothetical protein